MGPSYTYCRPSLVPRPSLLVGGALLLAGGERRRETVWQNIAAFRSQCPQIFRTVNKVRNHDCVTQRHSIALVAWYVVSQQVVASNALTAIASGVADVVLF